MFRLGAVLQKVELTLVQSPADFKIEDNRRRAEIGGKNSLTNQFAAWEHGEEVGFLSLDIYPPDQHPNVDWYTIYEIFVPRPLRSKGIGTRLLEAAEQAGRDRGLRYARLCAKPLDDSRTQEQLIEWYSRRGYKKMRDSSSTDMHKDLTLISDQLA